MFTKLRMWLVRKLLQDTNISVAWNIEVQDLIVASPCLVAHFAGHGTFTILNHRDWKSWINASLENAAADVIMGQNQSVIQYFSMIDAFHQYQSGCCIGFHTFMTDDSNLMHIL